MKATVYAVTTLHAAAEAFEAELPFQIAVIEMEDGARQTVRIEGRSVKIGDEVVEVADRRFRAASQT